jgi:hypothetical protein
MTTWQNSMTRMPSRGKRAHGALRYGKCRNHIAADIVGLLQIPHPLQNLLALRAAARQTCP